MSNWKMSRAGFIDFWYYDNETFYFEDGRLLLRGSNGSGKSVTMQSIIPLLLDGNKSPDRLDPFGSKARKIDNYLLDDNSSQDERTGYLYLEFVKEDSKSYMTIGLGIKAKRNTPVTSWGFCIVDGRRVGIDIELTKTTVGNIALTKKELQNRIGDGGFVFDSMSEYKAKVNSLLFGYDNIDDYSDLIKLLIQLRSPKLSKDFKPTVLYEIMTNSLQTLSDDDLRPMSEAIESMDETKLKLENLKEAQKSCKEIGKVYERYNKTLLFDSSQRYIEHRKGYRDCLDRFNKENKLLEESKALVKEGQDELERVEINENKYKTENENLKHNDIYKIEEKRIETKNNLEENKKRLGEKNSNLERKQNKRNEINDSIKRYTAEGNSSKKTIDEITDDLLNLADCIGFNDFDICIDELKKNIDSPYNFTSTERRFTEYKEKIRNAVKLLEEKRKIQNEYDDCQRKLDDALMKMEGDERNVKQSEQLFTDIKDEYIERVNSYSNKNQYLKLPKDSLEKINEAIYSYSTDKYFDSIRKIFTDCYEEYSKEFNKEISSKEHEIDQKQSQISAKQSEITNLVNMKDIEPERADLVINNRKRLDELKIPYTPLYMALEFDKDIDETTKSNIEEALIEMGLLDALVIPEKYKNKALEMDEGFADKYIFAAPNYLSYELSSMLHADRESNAIKSDIDDILKSVLLDNTDNSTFISKDGTYGIGIIKGKISGKYKAGYIGASTRKKHKQMKLESLNAELELLQEELKALEGELDAINKRLDCFNKEKGNFPSETDLDTAKNTLKSAMESFERSKSEYNDKKTKLDDVAAKLRKSKEECYYACERINVEPKEYEKYTEVQELCNDFSDNYSKLKSEHKIYLSKIELLSSKESEAADINADIDDLMYEIHNLNFTIKEQDEIIKSLEEQLKLSNYEEIKQRIEHCKNMLDVVIPRMREEANKKIYSNQNQIKNCNENIQKLDSEKEAKLIVLNKDKDKLIFECSLGLVWDDYDDSTDIDSYADKIYKELEYLNQQKTRENIEQSLNNIYYQERNALSEYVISLDNSMGRLQIFAKQAGKEITFAELIKHLRDSMEIQEQLIRDKDREIFEEILFNNLNKIIRAKIFQSKQWVKEMNDLMEGLDTSSGLTFSLRWKGKTADSEDEISTEELVKLLEKDPRLLREEDKKRFATHFKSKIDRARSLASDNGEAKSFHAIIKELLDYRQWYEFQLYYVKTNEKKKELTNNAFYQFSGGEKAMAMYVPLFSAVSARYAGANKDCPRIISLDEAFAGVDSKNIRDMFKLLRELKLGFIINSQVLWGDYDTVPRLGISEILRPNNSSVVSIIRYIWNGSVREMVTDND